MKDLCHESTQNARSLHLLVHRESTGTIEGAAKELRRDQTLFITECGIRNPRCCDEIRPFHGSGENIQTVARLSCRTAHKAVRKGMILVAGIKLTGLHGLLPGRRRGDLQVQFSRLGLGHEILAIQQVHQAIMPSNSQTSVQRRRLSQSHLHTVGVHKKAEAPARVPAVGGVVGSIEST
jgi:hypothetical protein